MPFEKSTEEKETEMMTRGSSTGESERPVSTDSGAKEVMMSSPSTSNEAPLRGGSGDGSNRPTGNLPRTARAAHLSSEDITSLLEEEGEAAWLTDWAVLVFCEWAVESDPTTTVIAPAVYWLPDKKEVASSVKQQLQGPVCRALFPVCISDHWSLLLITTTKLLFYYDSRGKQEIPKEIHDFAELLGVRAHMTRGQPQQRDGHNCGPIVCMWAQAIVRKKMLTQEQVDEGVVAFRMDFLLELNRRGYHVEPLIAKKKKKADKDVGVREIARRLSSNTINDEPIPENRTVLIDEDDEEEDEAASEEDDEAEKEAEQAMPSVAQLRNVTVRQPRKKAQERREEAEQAMPSVAQLRNVTVRQQRKKIQKTQKRREEAEQAEMERSTSPAVMEQILQSRNITVRRQRRPIEEAEQEEMGQRERSTSPAAVELNTLDAVARKKIAAELRSIANRLDPMDITPSGDAAMKEVETVEPRPQGAVKATRLNIGRSASEPLPKVPRLHGEYVVVNLEVDSSSPVNAESLIAALERIGIVGIEEARIRPLQGRSTGMTDSQDRSYATFETSDADLLRKIDEHCWTHVPVGNSQWIARYDSAVEYLLQLFVRRVQEKLPEHERIPLPDRKLEDSAFLERLLVRHEAAATAVYVECTRALKRAIQKTAKNVGIHLSV